MTSVSRQPLPTSDEIANLPPDGGAEFNRLIHATSPYLLQHARNPVDWHSWGEEAFAKAKEEGKPIFLSIGYSACHWCHVMEHESFENQAIASLINKSFIPVKVDREERPDIDEIYMTATQLMTGSGGWPNTLFLTPDMKPFFAGTYFPPEDRWGRPGFGSILAQLAEYWGSKHQEVEVHAERLSAAMKEASTAGAAQTSEKPAGELSRELIEDALADLASHFDRTHGGFGSAPKFPPHGALELLLREFARTKEAPLLIMAEKTLTSMMEGGIHDHLGGGFARYSTDDEWLVPHFEKMLYDNAQLSRVYVQAWMLTGSEDYRRTAVGTYEWVLREMTDPGGAFYSAIDADSEGEEGKFYLWTKKEILDHLGKEEGELFCGIYDVTDRGNFVDPHKAQADGSNILHLVRPIERGGAAGDAGNTARLKAARDALLSVREARIRPGLDDKILTSWNGLMIGSFALAGRVLNEPRYTEAASRAARFILVSMRNGDRLLSTARQGRARLNGYLDDYVFLAHGLLDLHEATGDSEWLDAARSLMDVVMKRFGDAGEGGYFFTSDDHEMLLYRWKDPLDKAIPSGNGIAARVLLKLHSATDDPDGKYLEASRALLIHFSSMLRRAMRGMQSFIIALAETLDEDRGDRRPDPNASSSTVSQGETETNVVSVRGFILKGPGSTEGKSEWTGSSNPLPVRRGDRMRMELVLDIARGWHIQSHSPLEDTLIPTAASIPRNETAELRSAEYPAGQVIETGGMSVSVYRDSGTTIRLDIAVLSSAPEGKSRFEVNVRYQPCMDKGACAAAVTRTIPIVLYVQA